ncbi:MAG: RsmD family RNA methyltransferase [Bacteroidales bacterium]|nr:RsmD family RNA methyltransferase [Bacteroidales bacterium]
MRIIGGSLKGKTIMPPANYAARPTTDFAKEGLFNMLTNEFDLEEISVLDLFAGTGSISMEFASRGCKDIISIEMNPLHTRFIKQCSQSFKIKGMQVIRHNVFDFIKICTKQFDLIFADPPYDLEGLDTLPDRIFGLTANTLAGEEKNCTEKEKNISDKKIFEENSKCLVKNGGYFILEHPKSYSFENHPFFLKEKKYGNVHFSFFEKKD